MSVGERLLGLACGAWGAGVSRGSCKNTDGEQDEQGEKDEWSKCDEQGERDERGEWNQQGE